MTDPDTSGGPRRAVEEASRPHWSSEEFDPGEFAPMWRLLQIGPALARTLGEGWSYTQDRLPHDPRWERPDRGLLTGPGGVQLLVAAGDFYQTCWCAVDDACAHDDADLWITLVIEDRLRPTAIALRRALEPGIASWAGALRRVSARSGDIRSDTAARIQEHLVEFYGQLMAVWQRAQGIAIDEVSSGTAGKVHE